MSCHYLPFNSHHSADRPLYAVAESDLPTQTQPPPEALIAFDRVSSRPDGTSSFFRALCERYWPASATNEKEASPDPSVSASAAISPALPVDWTRKATAPRRRKPVKPLPPKLRGGVLQKAIYTPHGKWAWAAGLPFMDSEPSVLLSSGVMCSAFLKTGKIGDRSVKYVSKMWLTKEKWHGFFSELALYKVQLKSLQGRVVPTIINVYSCAGAVDVAMEPPHHSFWIEASSDMPHILKKRCVQAFEKLHAAGVYHGDIELRHMLIAGDARVTIIDFQASRALMPNAAVQLAAASPDEMRLEMRKVKFKLNFEGARAWEDAKLMRAARLARRNQEGRRIEEPAEEDKIDPPVDSREWNLEWIGAPVEPARFVMPGQSREELESAVKEFLSILEKLEAEEKHRDGAATLQRKSSPEFKPPAVVPKLSGVQSPGMGFGAMVVHPTTPRALKRKGDCDRPSDARKRIRRDASSASASNTSQALRAIPDASESSEPQSAPAPSFISPSPPLKVRDFAFELPPPTQSHPVVDTDLQQPSTTRSPRLKSSSALPEILPRSPGKRKRPADSSDDACETRGQPKMRTSLSCDISSTAPSVAFKYAVSELKDTAPTHKDALFGPPPILFRWIENLWRLMS